MNSSRRTFAQSLTAVAIGVGTLGLSLAAQAADTINHPAGGC